MIESTQQVIDWVQNITFFQFLVIWFLGGLVVHNAWEFLFPEAHWASVYRRSLSERQRELQRLATELRGSEKKVERPEGTPALRDEKAMPEPTRGKSVWY